MLPDPDSLPRFAPAIQALTQFQTPALFLKPLPFQKPISTLDK